MMVNNVHATDRLFLGMVNDVHTIDIFSGPCMGSCAENQPRCDPNLAWVSLNRQSHCFAMPQEVGILVARAC